MLFCDTTGDQPRDFDELAVFVSQLAALGLPAAIHVRSVPAGLNRNTQFDVAPHLVDRAPAASDTLVLTAAHRMADARIARLRRMAGTPARAFGAFRDTQGRLGASARLGYVLGAEPLLQDLAARDGETAPGCPVVGVAHPGGSLARRAPDRPRVLLIAPDLADPDQVATLLDLTLSRRFEVAVLTDGRSKHDWRDARGAEVPVYHHGELLPAEIAGLADICVVHASARPSYRLRSLVANLAVSGRALIDATPDQTLRRAEDAFLRGPIRLAALGCFIVSDILPNLDAIAARTRASATARAADPRPLLRFLDATPASTPATASRRLVFMPTNGVGLGHAQRCARIATALSPATQPATFAAFPSCLGLIKSWGFDAMPLIGRSPHHAQTHENDLANYLRLRALTAGGGTLVFDGGYVFDSVYRAIAENRLRGVWVRRGLWQAGQDNSIALDREKIFERVIVPREAFDELNARYSQGDHIHEVGPIVERYALTEASRLDLRARLATRFGRPFTRLVVTQLGAGVAADRAAQIQALCGMMERRPDTLHLVVVWPTATLQPVWSSWTATRVVRTHRAGVLAAAADLCVSAAGYNSFHEALYNRVPTIFVPQTGPFMDDQPARARAARDLGVAVMVEPSALMSLEREVARALDDDFAATLRARLGALDLPPPGNRDAASLIEEMTDGRRPALDRPAFASRSKGRA